MDRSKPVDGRYNNLESRIVPPETRERSVDYQILTSPESREKLRKKAVELVREIHDKKVDTLVYLDRSARPLSWLMRDIWCQEFPGESLPATRYMNIGHETFVHHKPLPFQKHVGSNEGVIADSIFTQVRAESIVNNGAEWFSVLEIPEDIREQISKYVHDRKMNRTETHRKFLPENSRHVLVIDDFYSSGQSIVNAIGIVHSLVPHAQVEGVPFAIGVNARKDKMFDRELMPWLRTNLTGVIEVEDWRSAPLSKHGSKSASAEIRKRLEGEWEKLDQAIEALQEQMIEFFLWFESISDEEEKGYPDEVWNNMIDVSDYHTEIQNVLLPQLRVRGKRIRKLETTYTKPEISRLLSDFYSVVFALNDKVNSGPNLFPQNVQTIIRNLLRYTELLNGFDEERTLDVIHDGNRALQNNRGIKQQRRQHLQLRKELATLARTVEDQ